MIFSHGHTTHFIDYILPLFMLLGIPLLLFILSFLFRNKKLILRYLAMMTPCYLAPLSITGHWILIPSNIFLPSSGGYKYFLNQLINNSDSGNINYQVLLIIICAIVSAFIPVIFAIYHLVSRKSRVVILILVLIINFALIVPILVLLDSLWWEGNLYLPFGLFKNPWLAITLLANIGGPLLRIIPLFIMTTVCISRKPSPIIG